MYRRCQPLAPKHKFKFKNKLYSLDAAVVSLGLSLFPWAFFRRHQGRALKLHTLLDHDGYLPAFVAGSPARGEPDIKKARSLAEFLRLIDPSTPKELHLHLTVDNYVTHKHKKVKECLIRHPRFHFHFVFLVESGGRIFC